MLNLKLFIRKAKGHWVSCLIEKFALLTVQHYIVIYINLCFRLYSLLTSNSIYKYLVLFVLSFLWARIFIYVFPPTVAFCMSGPDHPTLSGMIRSFNADPQPGTPEPAPIPPASSSTGSNNPFTWMPPLRCKDPSQEGACSAAPEKSIADDEDVSSSRARRKPQYSMTKSTNPSGKGIDFFLMTKLENIKIRDWYLNATPEEKANYEKYVHMWRDQEEKWAEERKAARTASRRTYEVLKPLEMRGR